MAVTINSCVEVSQFAVQITLQCVEKYQQLFSFTNPTWVEPPDLILFTTPSGASNFVILAKTEESQQTIITYKQESEHKSNFPLVLAKIFHFLLLLEVFCCQINLTPGQVRTLMIRVLQYNLLLDHMHMIKQNAPEQIVLHF